MQSRNPVLGRIGQDQPVAPGGAGFAYDEGRTAYQTAGAAAAGYAQTDALNQMYAAPAATGKRVSIDDVVVKTSVLLVLVVTFAVGNWFFIQANPGVGWGITIGAGLVGFGLGLVNTFKKQVSPALVMAYAVVQGLFLGGISFLYQNIAGGTNVVGQAVLGTVVAFAVMLTLYRTRIIRVNGTFIKVMIVAMVSYMVIALASLVASFFGVGQGWGFYGVGGIGLLLCAAGVLLAAFCLALDFEAIKQGIAMGLPERESWRLSFGLLVTLIWLYLELLRLLAILNSSD